MDLDTRLQKIKSYSEPENLVKTDNSLSKPPSSFVEELQMMISMVEKYNGRLETSLRHLSEII